jgi:hypothetical protein
MRDQIELRQSVDQALGQLTQIEVGIRALHEEVQPLLTHWQSVVRRASQLTWRLRVRFASLWLLDIVVPLALAAIAIWKTYAGVHFVLAGSALCT